MLATEINKQLYNEKSFLIYLESSISVNYGDIKTHFSLLVGIVREDRVVQSLFIRVLDNFLQSLFGYTINPADKDCCWDSRDDQSS